MTRPLFACALTLLAAVVAGCSSSGVSEDQNSLQGTWYITSATIEGKTPSAQELARLKAMRFVIDGCSITPCCVSLGCAGSAEFTLNSDQPMKEITLVSFNNSCCCAGSHVVKGIYKVEGDSFVYCIASDGERPTSFTSEPSSKNALFTMKREGGAVTKKDASVAEAKTLTLVDKDTKQTVVVPAGTKVVFPENSFKNGVLEVWYPQKTIVQLNAATKAAITQLGDTYLNETSMQNKTADGTILFGKTPAGVVYTCTLAPGENFSLIRIHYGDWGHQEESQKIANKIADRL